MSIVLARGDVVLTRFPYTDLTGQPFVPALVDSAGRIGQDFVLAGISSILRSGTIPTDLVIDLTNPEFRHTGLRVASVIRLHKIASVESKVITRRLGRIGPQLQAEVDRLLRTVFGL